MRLGLKLAILQAGKTQRSVSAETGIHETRLSTLVNGWSEVRPAERLALQRVLHVGPDAFDRDATVELRSAR